MIGYSAIEQAILAKLVSVFPSELDPARCTAGDPDAMFTAIFDAGAEYGCFVEFNGGAETNQQPFKMPVWVWQFAAVFVIRYGDGIEAKLRTIVDRLALAFAEDHTLGGITPRVRIVEIGDAEPGDVNEVPFYWLPFIIEAIDR